MHKFAYINMRCIDVVRGGRPSSVISAIVSKYHSVVVDWFGQKNKQNSFKILAKVLGVCQPSSFRLISTNYRGNSWQQQQQQLVWFEESINHISLSLFLFAAKRSNKLKMIRILTNRRI